MTALGGNVLKKETVAAMAIKINDIPVFPLHLFRFLFGDKSLAVADIRGVPILKVTAGPLVIE